MALKLYIDKVIRPGQDFKAYAMASEFCFRKPGLAYNESVNATNRTSSSYPERRYLLLCGASNRKRKAAVKLSEAT